MTTTPPGRRSNGRASTADAFAWATIAVAGSLLATVGVLQVLQGLSALAEDDVFAISTDYWAALDLTTWGWVHVGVGAVAAAVGIALLTGATWARVAGLLLATVSVVTNFAFIPYYPVWAFVLITIDVVVLWALCHQLDSPPDL
ncbi:DUF7144 family membrane protein [Aeromicrobium massiliense]|uniref:DUF7144 family membrane protein n=1 Tax=Aeromicrobium massiliense TaxID=1464554 RepID=UPI000314FD86|nr:hypothetical protein [Aeromicrobium massiliense]